jgi:RND superfamily putative drug exporter
MSRRDISNRLEGNRNMRSTESRNLAGSLGRWSAGHRLAAIGVWIAFVAVAVTLGSMAGTVQVTATENDNGQSKVAEQILDEAGFQRPAGEAVLIQAATGGADDANVQSAVADVIRAVQAVPAVVDVSSPYTTGNQGQIAADRRSVLVQFSIAGDPKNADGKIAPVLAAVQRVAGEHPDVYVAEVGETSFNHQATAQSGGNQSPELLAGILTLVILVVAFGAVVSALLPLVLAVSAIAGASGLVGLASHLVHVNGTATIIMTLVGMAVGVDYSMFYIRRFLEERAAGRDKHAALAAAANTSGRSVLVSGVTVMASMAGMFLAGNATFSGIAIATMVVVSSSVVASVTVLPALLALLGDKVDRPRVPFLHRLRRPTEGSRFWGAIIGRVLRRPVLALSLGVAFLLAMAAPALSMVTAGEGVTDFARSLPVVQSYDRFQQAFPGGPGPAEVVVSAPDVTAPAVAGALGQLRSLALATGEMHEPFSVRVDPAKTVAVVEFGLDGTGTDSASRHAVSTLRGRVIPEAFGALEASSGGTVRVDVTGAAAAGFDFTDQLNHAVPIVFAFVLALAFVLLLISFRSIVVALKAIVLNLLSVGAAYGFLVLVFQHHWADGILGYTSNGAIVAWLPLFLFTLLFGLSMDYHVLVLSRIREAYDRGMRTEDAVSHGIRSTAGVISSAAVIMVAVFSVFATIPQVSMKEAGLGLAFAVLVDATVIRAVLLPAAMTLLGDRNWYLPRWLGWLPPMFHGEVVQQSALDVRELGLVSAGQD